MDQRAGGPLDGREDLFSSDLSTQEAFIEATLLAEQSSGRKKKSASTLPRLPQDLLIDLAGSGNSKASTDGTSLFPVNGPSRADRRKDHRRLKANDRAVFRPTLDSKEVVLDNKDILDKVCSL